jgi:hypothetical protein
MRSSELPHNPRFLEPLNQEQTIMLKARLLFAALIAALTMSFAATAAEDKPATEDKPAAAEKKTEAKKKVRPHQHPADAKGGFPADVADKPEAEPKKPLHDHQQFHK